MKVFLALAMIAAHGYQRIPQCDLPGLWLVPRPTRLSAAVSGR
jgi:hypothetical protein